MSTAFYPTNMRQQASSGYSNHSSLENIAYKSWKGKGIFSNPVGVTATHIRPLTNRDPGNIFPTGFGLPRPIKHYRKGTVFPVYLNPVLNTNATPVVDRVANIEKSLIARNINRSVKSSTGQSLGGGNGGTGLISQMMEMPGYFIVKDNRVLKSLDDKIHSIEDFNGANIDAECKDCNGVGIVSSWMPINNLTEKPEPNVTNPLLCCNQQRKALQRVLPTNTNINKNYYQTTYMYLYNRCQTFQQRQFNFLRGVLDPKIFEIIKTYPFVSAKIIEYLKPGDPLSNLNYYVAQCNPNFTIERGIEIGFINLLSKSLLNAAFISKTDYDLLIQDPELSIKTFFNSIKKLINSDQYKLVVDYLYQLSVNPNNGSIIGKPSNPRGCSQVYYKPNNPQFAKQGGVSSSTRTLKLNVDTISTAAYRRNRLDGGNPYLYKDKSSPCQPQTYTGNPFFFSGQRQNKLICQNKTNGGEYHTYNSIYQRSAGNYIGATQSA